MKVLIDKSFQKDLKKINDKKILHSIASIIDHLSISESLTSFPHCSKIVGSSDAYRIRLKDFRIGIKFKNGTAILLRFLHRKEIYKFFP